MLNTIQVIDRGAISIVKYPFVGRSIVNSS